LLAGNGTVAGPAAIICKRQTMHSLFHLLPHLAADARSRLCGNRGEL